MKLGGVSKKHLDKFYRVCGPNTYFCEVLQYSLLNSNALGNLLTMVIFFNYPLRSLFHCNVLVEARIMVVGEES